jgi:hypothetical protein
MADPSSETTEGSVDRSGDVPNRIRNTTVLHDLHSALGDVLGLGGKSQVTHGGKTVEDTVDEAVRGAKGDTSYGS